MASADANLSGVVSMISPVIGLRSAPHTAPMPYVPIEGMSSESNDLLYASRSVTPYRAPMLGSS